MSSYIRILGEAVAPGQAGPVAALATATPAAVKAGKMPVGIGNVALAAGLGYAGHRVWKKHSVLGAVVGASVGFHAPNIIRGDAAARKEALIGLGVTGIGVGASLAWKKRPALGYLLGAGAASIASFFVPGAPMQHLVADLKKKIAEHEQAKRLGLSTPAALSAPAPVAKAAA